MLPLSDNGLEVLLAKAAIRLAKTDANLIPCKPGLPLSDMTLTKVLRDIGDGSITVHRFRSSFRDWAAEQSSMPGDVVEAALTHTIRNKVKAACRRTNYLEKRRMLMETWGSFLVH